MKNEKISWSDFMKEQKGLDTDLPEARNNSLPDGYNPEEQSLTVGCCFFSWKNKPAPEKREVKWETLKVKK